MLSGDRQATANSIAGEIGLDNAWGQLLPEEKVSHLEELKKLGSVVYAGDGINDAPVLAAADVAWQWAVWAATPPWKQRMWSS